MHTHRFKYEKLTDGSVRRVCRCGLKIVDVARGKFSHEIGKKDQRRRGRPRKNKAHAHH